MEPHTVNRSQKPNTIAVRCGDREAGADRDGSIRAPRRPQPPHRSAETLPPGRHKEIDRATASDLIERARVALRRKNDPRLDRARTIYLGFFAAACRQGDLDLQGALHELVTESRTAAGLAARRARHHAIYLTHWIARIRQADIARAAELSRASLCVALRGVEEKSDRDAETAALLNEIARDLVPGRGH